jgi:hypothetical protein
MGENKTEQLDVSALHQLVQDIIGGSMRRNTFTQWELELLLDLQTCGVRKGARSETLRRYLRAVQQHYAQGAMGPLRLSTFLDRENAKSRANTPSNLRTAALTSEPAASVL